jgi:thiamine-phosphate pyrophosphorylase
MTDETGRLFIVNDRPDVAAIVGADGLHLGQHDLPIAEARRLLRPGAIIGRSTHNIEQAKAAVTEGADYVSIGPIFETTTKDAGPIAGLEVLRQVLTEIQLPVVAVGGINAGNISEVTGVGAKCVAVCSAVTSADSPKAAAEAIKKLLL